MNEISFMFLKVVVAVCAALITAYVVPYLRALKNDTRYGMVIDMVTLAVKAAEQTFREPGKGAEKKAEVIRFVSGWLGDKGIEITEDELNQLIESAVFAMKQGE